jgi:8-oxo-dGTP pyrophosphatase MutT (NUDIX family)
MSDSTGRFEIVSDVVKYSNPWMSVRELEIARDGQPGIYGIVDRADAVVIVVRTSRGRYLFRQQYRFPTDALSWELPMGGVEASEDPDAAARRELLEETGLEVDLVQIGEFRPVPGLTAQRVHVFLADDVPDEVVLAEEARVGEDEIVGRALLDDDDLAEMIGDGRISDGFTLSSMHVHRRLMRP